MAGEGVEGAQALQIQHVSDATRYRATILACAKGSRAASLPHDHRPRAPRRSPVPPARTARTGGRPTRIPRPAGARRALDWRIRFAALSLIWGFSFLLIKVGTEGFAPFQVTLGRLLFGTAVLAWRRWR